MTWVTLSSPNARAISSGRLKRSGEPFRLTPPPYQPGHLPEPSWPSRFGARFELRCFQLFSIGAWLHGMPYRTTVRLEAPARSSSRTMRTLPSDGQHPQQVEYHLSRDGVNPTHVPHYRAYSPALGGLCTTRMGRVDIEEASRGVDVDSCPRQLCYPWGNFSDTSSPQREGHEGSLGPAFASGHLAFRCPVRPAFSLALYGGFLSRLS